ncbi:uncharacterized protein LOC117643360 [Thrips palmi]|uniref:Uncharacterized protein LOC117643360 n=1 Tax=Thrips palmi TaxID=161013 RepID=A0A6P8ZL21_THRPL|nr:uncharacterized protein LOC117643360 [Thrips palmi]
MEITWRSTGKASCSDGTRAAAAQTAESNSNVSAIQPSQTLEPISVGTRNAASAEPDVFSSASHLSRATQAESDSNAPVIQPTQPIDSGPLTKSSVEPDALSFSSLSHSPQATQAESDSNAPVIHSTQTSEPIESGLPNKPSIEPDAFISKLLENLKLLLPKYLQLEVLDNSLLRIVKLNTSRNAVVQSCVYYDHKNQSVGLFVNGMPIPNENKVFDCKTAPDATNIGSLSDYLCELVTRVGQFKVCKGVHDHDELWETSRGFLDYSSSVEDPCFRNAECLFLISSGKSEICFGCRAQVQKFKKGIKKNGGRKRR